jgi:integrase
MEDKMAIYSRQLKTGNRYFFKFDHQGKTHRSGAVYKTKTEAKRAEAQKRLEAEKSGDHDNIMLIELMNARLDYIKETRSAEYYNQNKRYFKRFLDHVGNIPVRRVKTSMVNGFLLEMHKDYKQKGFDNWKVNDCLRVIKALFYSAINLYDLDIRNPCRKIPTYRVEKKNKYIPTDEEIEAVKAKCSDEQALLIQFCLETGARVNEALRLTEIGDDYIVLYSRKNKEGLEPRKLPKPPCLIGRHFDGRPFSNWSIERTPHFLMNKCDWGFHNLRHKFAIESMKRGKSVAQLMYELGHSQLSTTTIYLRSLGFVDL